MTDLAHYYFIPTIREGLAAYLQPAASPLPVRAQIDARLTAHSNGHPDQIIPNVVTLYGPGDVVGIDESVVGRTDPTTNVWDFESNYLPACDLLEPDLPWRFTPNGFGVAGSSYLQPWISLVALEPGIDFDDLGEKMPPEDQKSALPIRWIHNVDVMKLPNLDYAWRWAHVQVTAEDNLQLSDLQRRVSGEGNAHVVARLLCPRRLTPTTKYTAFIVPTFKIGQVASGLTTLSGNDDAMTLGWDKLNASAPRKVDLPYYYSWNFSTAAGDFEYLVRLLQPRPLPGLGKRRIDCSTIGYALPPCPGPTPEDAEVMEIEGALMSPDLDSGHWLTQSPQVATFRGELANLINQPATRVANANSADAPRPKVVPPVFGRWHAGRTVIDPSVTTPWQDELNLDPRKRAAAGFGALIVQKEQEALMASLWDQLGDIDLANQLVSYGQLGEGASTRVFGRLGILTLPAFLWISSPVFDRVRAPQSMSTTPATIAQVLATSPIPRAAFDPAFRRILRIRGGVRKHQKNVGAPRSGWDMLSRLNVGDIAAAGPPPTLTGMPSMCGVTDAALARLHRNAAPAREARGAFRIIGRVVYTASRHPVARARVEVWDKDPFFSDLIGGAETDPQGAFVVQFDGSYFREWFLDRRPDLFFKVFRGDALLKSTQSSVLRNVRPGDTNVTIELDTDVGAPTPPRAELPRVFDFCEEAITPQDVLNAATGSLQNHRPAAEAIANALVEWLTPLNGATIAPVPADLPAIHDAVKTAIDPKVTIPARMARRLKLGPGARQREPLARIESKVEFPQPLYESVAAISQDLILPGVQSVPQNTISVLKTNRAGFIEPLMLAFNDAVAGEALWRGAPVYLWTTFARQFWQVQGLIDTQSDSPENDPELFKDITRIASWKRESLLGSHSPRPTPPGEDVDRACILIRGDVLKRYPRTVVYAVEAQANGNPALAEYDPGTEGERLWPMFSGSLPPDLTFLGFDITPENLCRGGSHHQGYFIVLEERLGESRFGFDLADPEATLPSLTGSSWWYDATWDHMQPPVPPNSYIDSSTIGPTGGRPRFGDTAATVANTCLQRSVRIAIHMRQMSPPEICGG